VGLLGGYSGWEAASAAVQSFRYLQLLYFHHYIREKIRLMTQSFIIKERISEDSYHPEQINLPKVYALLKSMLYIWGKNDIDDSRKEILKADFYEFDNIFYNYVMDFNINQTIGLVDYPSDDVKEYALTWLKDKWEKYNCDDFDLKHIDWGIIEKAKKDFGDVRIIDSPNMKK